MKRLTLLLAPALFLGACSSLTGPSSDDMARLPVVRYGQTPPAQQDFVLLYPAGADLPVSAQVAGNLFEKTDQATLTVRLKQDLYVYKDRISFDGKNWQKAHSGVSGQFRIDVPGERDGKLDAQSPGQLRAEYNRR